MFNYKSVYYEKW